jgi:hypothetical protein
VRPNSRKIKSVPMKIANDPALWRFGSLQQAVEVANDLIAEVIYGAKEHSMAVECKDDVSLVVPISEEPKVSN